MRVVVISVVIIIEHAAEGVYQVSRLDVFTAAWHQTQRYLTFRTSRALFAPPLLGVFGGGDRE